MSAAMMRAFAIGDNPAVAETTFATPWAGHESQSATPTRVTVAADVATEAQRRAPVRTGKLKRSIRPTAALSAAAELPHVSLTDALELLLLLCDADRGGSNARRCGGMEGFAGRRVT